MNFRVYHTLVKFILWVALQIGLVLLILTQVNVFLRLCSPIVDELCWKDSSGTSRYQLCHTLEILFSYYFAALPSCGSAYSWLEISVVIHFNYCSSLNMFMYLKAREYLYFKLYGKQCITPVAIMTSAAKNNHERISSLCEKLQWFGRGRSTFQLFEQV